MSIELYDWQKEIINHKGSIAVRGGRQSGKSWAGAYRIKKLIQDYPGCTILITSPSEKQELYLYEKVKSLFTERDFKKRPTLKHAKFRNGSQIFKFPVGKTGILIEGLSSVDFLFVDEAINMTERAMDAIMPMLLEPRKRGLGWINLFGNTRGRPKGFFYESFKNPDYKSWAISSEDVPHADKDFLAKEKMRLGEMRYRMIYIGDFVEMDYKFFPDAKIDASMTLKSWKLKENYSHQRKYVLGIDPAGFGRDKAAFVVGECFGKERIRIVHFETYPKTSTHDLLNITISLDNKFFFNKFLIDSSGMGRGFTDLLKLKRKGKVVELNNSASGKEGKVLKEDMYSWALALMENSMCEIIYSPEIKNSLSNVEFDGEQFYGKDSDIAEAFVRACWGLKEIGYSPKIV